MHNRACELTRRLVPQLELSDQFRSRWMLSRPRPINGRQAAATK
jgi:hypothetical protein